MNKIDNKIRYFSNNHLTFCLVPGTSSGRPIGTATRLTTASGVSKKQKSTSCFFFVQ